MKSIQKLLNNYENKFSFHLNICCCFFGFFQNDLFLFFTLISEGIQEHIHIFKSIGWSFLPFSF